jgi:carbon starvation protein CstA
LWRYFAWCNQTLSVFTLWAVTVYLARARKNYWITLIPALFMTSVCSTYICIAPEGFSLPAEIAYGIGIASTLTGAIWFILWYRKQHFTYEKI